VLVGEQASILQSGVALETSLTANKLGAAGFELAGVGQSGAPYRLQASTTLNMADWIDVLSFTNTQPTISLTDTSATSFTQRFYRLVSP
jgi:hypothetical protein